MSDGSRRGSQGVERMAPAQARKLRKIPIRRNQFTIMLDGERPTVQAVLKRLGRGMPLFVFPEGGRTATGALKPFLSGAAYLAIRAQVPLVPIALTGVYDLLPIHTRHFYPGELALSVGEPIETKGMTPRQTEELSARLRASIGELLQPEREMAKEQVEEDALSASD